MESETSRSWEARGNSVFLRSRFGRCVRCRPITRLFYSRDHNDLYACSYDKCIRRLDMTTTRFESLFKADSRFDEDVFLHHCLPHPSDEHLFLVSLSNGSVFLLVSTQRGDLHRLAHSRRRVFLSGTRQEGEHSRQAGETRRSSTCIRQETFFSRRPSVARPNSSTSAVFPHLGSPTRL